MEGGARATARPTPISMILLAYQFDWSVVTDRWQLFVAGAWIDLWVATIGFALACGIGLVYVLLLWVYFGVANITGITFTNFQAIVIALALTGSGYTTEIFRAGLGAIERGQMEAARSIGLSRVHTDHHVTLPQAFRIVVPPLGNTFVGLLKGATIMALIAVPDMVFLANELNVTLFTPFEVFAAVALILVVMVLFFSAIVYVLERRLRIG